MPPSLQHNSHVSSLVQYTTIYNHLSQFRCQSIPTSTHQTLLSAYPPPLSTLPATALSQITWVINSLSPNPPLPPSLTTLHLSSHSASQIHFPEQSHSRGWCSSNYLYWSAWPASQYWRSWGWSESGSLPSVHLCLNRSPWFHWSTPISFCLIHPTDQTYGRT